MAEKKYVIGVDFGTESARAVLVEAATGEEASCSVEMYPHGVMSESIPGGRKLMEDWHLQDAMDYIQVLRDTVRTVVREGNVSPQQVIGVGIDFTASTILPVGKNLEPMSAVPEYAGRPHSYVKLWKHHAAQKEADQITELAAQRGETFLKRYGGKISSEWMFPKILQILHQDPELYQETDLFMEAGDWLVSRMVGNIVRSTNTSGYKGMWSGDSGYPSNDFFKALDQRLDGIADTRMRGEIRPVGTRAGGLTQEFSALLGLCPGTAVAVNVIDAHAAVIAVGAVKPGQFVMAMGTSTCQMLIAERETMVEGICGCVKDGIIPGCYSYETGQVAVGDSFAWFVNGYIGGEMEKAAGEEGLGLHAYLEKEAAKQKAGEHGLMALDWWNGNRTDLVDANLSGAIIGMTLQTKPADLYRALLESTAFGARKIMDNFIKNQVEVNELFACGGLPAKNSLLLQIYADVLNREIRVAQSGQITALGAAIYAALAAGKSAGGYDQVQEAAEAMAKVRAEPVVPIAEHVEAYDRLYRIYDRLHDFFGVENADIMHGLKEMRTGEGQAC